MSSQARFRFVRSIFLFSLVATPMALSQGVPIAFELDDSGIISREFTNPRQPFPLECLLTGKCGEGDSDLKFPRMGALVKKNENGMNFEEFYFRFHNLSNTKTYLVNIPMEIKVSELLKYIIRADQVHVNESEMRNYLARIKEVDQDLEKLPNHLKQSTALGIATLVQILNKAVTFDQISQALSSVAQSHKGKNLTVGDDTLDVETLHQRIKNFHKNLVYLKFLREQNLDPQSELWKEFNDKSAEKSTLINTLLELEKIQIKLLAAYKAELGPAYPLTETEFRIREDFAKIHAVDPPGRQQFLEEVMSVCQTPGIFEDAEPPCDQSNKESIEGLFGEFFKKHLFEYNVFEKDSPYLRLDGKIEFALLNDFQKSVLLSFFGKEILLLSSAKDLDFLEFLTHFYLGKEKSPIGGTPGSRDPQPILKSILLKACAAKEDLFSGNFNFLMPPGNDFKVLSSHLSILHAVSMPREEMLTISVSVFNENDIITRSNGYVVWKGGRDLKSKSGWKLAGTIGYKQTPFLKDTPVYKPLGIVFLNDAGIVEGGEGDRKVVGELKPYLSDQSEFFDGSGKLTLGGNLNTLAEANVVLQYHARNFGAEDTSDKVNAAEYKLVVHEKNGNSVAFGKFSFDSPSGGLGINLRGEGLHWRHNLFDLGHLIRKESETGTPDAANRDHKVLWGRLPNLGLPRWGIFHRLSFHALYGQNEKDVFKVKAAEFSDIKGRPFFPESSGPDTDPLGYYSVEEDSQPYSYWTLGLQQRFSAKHSDVWFSSGYLSYFQSERRARSSDATASLPVPGASTSEDGEPKMVNIPRDPFADGEGRSWLLSWSLQENNIKDKQKPENDIQHQFTFLVGHGSGGFREANHLDRGYLGETSSFAPDMIFLSRLAPALARVEPTIGAGLSNKSYASISYQRNGSSLIKGLMQLAGWDETIAKASTTFSLHYYRLNTIDMPREERILGSVAVGTSTEPFVLQSKNLGWEFNLKTQAALPNNIKPQFMAAYFAPGSALDDLVKKDLWFAGLSLSLEF